MNTFCNNFAKKMNVFVAMSVVFDCNYFFYIIFVDLDLIFIAPIIVINCELNVLSEFDFHGGKSDGVFIKVKLKMVGGEGIEPPTSAYKAPVLPLN